MIDAVLLDTCAVIWIANDDAIGDEARDAVRTAEQEAGVFISPITAWEIAVLASKGRLTLTIPVENWFDRLLELPGTVLAEMPPRTLIRSASLPGSPPSDPADRIIAASARELGIPVVTRDRELVKYADAGHVRVIPC